MSLRQFRSKGRLLVIATVLITIGLYAFIAIRHRHDVTLEPIEVFRHAYRPSGSSTSHSPLPDYVKCHDVMRPTPDVIKYRHTHWQFGRDRADEVVVYAAFYDDRPAGGPLPFIRLHGVVRIIPDEAKDAPLHCQIWFDGNFTEKPLIIKANVITTGRNHGITGGYNYGQRLISCPLSTASPPYPTHVSLVIGMSPCRNSTILLPVVRSSLPTNVTHTVNGTTSETQSPWKHEFAVCVESSFGAIPVEVLVEWLEAYRLFGVTLFNIYNGSISSELDPVFKFYTGKDGEEVVALRQLPPSVDDYSEEGIRLSSPTSLNDCMMRSMYSSRFVVVVDYDEIIVPRLHATYSEMISHIDSSLKLTESHHTYSFRNAYFFIYQPQDETQPKHMRSLRFRKRSPPNGFLFGAKSFLDPRRCLSTFNHYCWIQFEKTPGPISIDVDQNVGLSHHYRGSCPLGTEACTKLDDEAKVDDIMMTYKERLQARVDIVLRTIGKLK